MSLKYPDYSEIDYSEIALAIGLKEKHIPMLLESFLEEAGVILENMKEAIASKDYATIDTTAHSIKGSAGNLRFNELQEMARSLEIAGKAAEENFDYEAYFEAISKTIVTIKL